VINNTKQKVGNDFGLHVRARVCTAAVIVVGIICGKVRRRRLTFEYSIQYYDGYSEHDRRSHINVRNIIVYWYTIS